MTDLSLEKLHTVFPLLADIASEAERFVSDAPEACLIKCRRIHDVLTADLWRRFCPADPVPEDIADRCDILIRRAYIEGEFADLMRMSVKRLRSAETGREAGGALVRACFDDLCRTADALCAHEEQLRAAKSEAAAPRGSKISRHPEASDVSIPKSVAASIVLTFLVWIWEILSAAFSLILSPAGLALASGGLLIWICCRAIF